MSWQNVLKVLGFFVSKTVGTVLKGSDTAKGRAQLPPLIPRREIISNKKWEKMFIICYGGLILVECQ